MEFKNPIVLAYQSGDWENALELATQTLNAAGTDKEKAIALAWRSRIRCAVCDIVSAQQDAELAQTYEQTHIVSIALAESALSNGRLTLAFSIISTAWEHASHTDPLTRTAIGITFSIIEAARGHGEAAYGRALRSLAECPDSELFLIAEAQITLANAALSIGRLGEAEAAVQKALDARLVCPNSPWMAECYHTLGRVKRHQNLPFKAVSNHQKAIEIWSQNHDFFLGALASSHHALAQAIYRCGDFHEARNEMARAVLLTKQRLGADHVDTWISRFELARYDIDCGDLTDGFEVLRKARDEVVQRLGPEHPVVQSMNQFI